MHPFSKGGIEISPLKIKTPLEAIKCVYMEDFLPLLNIRQKLLENYVILNFFIFVG